MATGRRPNVEAWQAAGLAQTERGWLKVDPATLEAQPGVFGAGDVTGLGGFTHVAYYHGQVIARRLRGIDARADHTAVPRVTFTDPEIASVGLSEAAARAQGIDVVVASADPAETARGYIHDFHGGAIKLVADRERGVLIGATLVTPRAGEIVGELVLAIKLGTPLKTLADVIHPFPAFNRVLEKASASSPRRSLQRDDDSPRRSDCCRSRHRHSVGCRRGRARPGLASDSDDGSRLFTPQGDLFVQRSAGRQVGESRTGNRLSQRDGSRARGDHPRRSNDRSGSCLARRAIKSLE